MNRVPLLAGFLAVVASLTFWAHGQEPAATLLPAQHFRDRVAPVLAQHCLQCHNRRKARASLDLSTRSSLLEGGEHGPAIVPGDAKKSLLYQMIAGSKPRMPQQQPPLAAGAVADIARWIDAGAPWPGDLTLDPQTDREPAETWWSLRPLVRPVPPSPNDAEKWVRNTIDQFILATLRERRLTPSNPADRITLIRRVTYDLTGLPPTPEEIDAFVGDTSPDAYEKLVDRLLASPRYAERWARLWLDLVHYADTHGYDKDKRRLWAWLYRDWVVRALAGDMPYRRFIEYQLAGDVLFPSDPDGVIATGFVVAGPWDFVGQVELREGTVDKEKTRSLDRDDMVASTISTFCSMTAQCARCHDHKFDPIPQQDYYRLQAVFAGVERGDRPVKGQKVFAIVPMTPRPIHVLKRGDVEQRGALVTPGGLTLLPGLNHHFNGIKPGDEGSRRAALARWITDDANVLTWRSIANRIWQHHFGKGLVDTPNDFGKNGSRPTHAALLDWLACEFRGSGGSLKRLHKLIVMSATYRQASQSNAAFAKIDADNRYLWRMNRQRLDAEEIRDSVLAISGTLDRKMFGPGFELFRFKDDHSPVYDHLDVAKINDPATFRRTIYRFVVRSVPNPFLDNLDCADPNLSVPVRNTTLTALQALTLLNDPFMLKQAECFAQRLQKMHGDRAGQVTAAYRLAFGRTPSAAECAALADYVERHGLANGCRLLFNANEFLFVD